MQQRANSTPSGIIPSGSAAPCVAEHPLTARFEQFIAEAESLSAPFYARLAAVVCRSGELLQLAAHCRATPIPNLFFAAIHDLLRRGGNHVLAEYFPSLRERPRDDDGLPVALQGFCRDHRAGIQQLLETRRVQTNEVNRCCAFLPGLHLVFEQGGRRPLALVDVGTSAGLNLFCDRFAYRYDATLHAGPADSRVQLECQLRGPVQPPVPRMFPPIGKRVGLDLAPIDLANPDQRFWLESLVWPDHRQRLARLQAAIEIARRAPPEIIRGDARTALPGIVAAMPSELTCCLFHSAAFNQLDQQEQNEIDRQLLAASTNRDIYRLAAEFEQFILHAYRRGAHAATALATFDSHGRWLEWKA